MERPTQEHKTPGGHVVVANTYITAGEKRQITDIYLDAGDTKRAPVQGEPRAMFRAQDKTIELAVLSLDGSSENIVQRILNLPDAEAEEILEIVKEVVEPKKN